MIVRLGHIWWPLAATTVLAVVLAVVGRVVDDGPGLLGALLGVGLLTGGYLVSNLALAWADSIMPKLVLTIGLATYIFKITMLGVVLLVVIDQNWAGVRMTAIGMICTMVIWISAQIWSSVRATAAIRPGVLSD
ncbi:hypothetical protein JCM9533A_74000 [Catenuloplanes niger JCM 9533]